MTSVKPVILIFGPSGVGKSFLSSLLLKQKFLCVYIDTDSSRRTFAANGFSSDWDNDFHNVNFGHLVRELRKRLENGHTGAVVSFPTLYLFTAENLVEAAQLGATPVVLWGKQVDCKLAAERRINKKGGSFNLARYERLNAPTFQAYHRPEYSAFRVEAFREDGSRFRDETLLKQIVDRTGMTARHWL